MQIEIEIHVKAVNNDTDMRSHGTITISHAQVMGLLQEKLTEKTGGTHVIEIQQAEVYLS